MRIDVQRKPRDFKQIVAWQKAHELALDVYRASATWPVEERFGLSNQIRRASASITSNIAEGCGRGTEAELARFMANSMGSASEVEYQLLLARDLGYLTAHQHASLDERIREVGKMLAGYINKLQG